MIVKEIQAKNILSQSKIHEYTLNAYVGCAHRCIYCYARFMKRFTGHREPWGEFVDVKVNAPELLEREIRAKKKGTVWVSGVCDAYQPLEEKYGLTGRCLKIFADHGWPVTIQTKSPLVLRDIAILAKMAAAEVGFTITTADERVRGIFEPDAPPVEKRIEALGILHAAGIRTFVMVAPILPGFREIVGLVKGKIDRALIDRNNYPYADWAYNQFGLAWAKGNGFFEKNGGSLAAAFQQAGIPCRKLY